eukprot:746742-Hanusia_phi.AAC.3
MSWREREDSMLTLYLKIQHPSLGPPYPFTQIQEIYELEEEVTSDIFSKKPQDLESLAIMTIFPIVATHTLLSSSAQCSSQQTCQSLPVSVSRCLRLTILQNCSSMSLVLACIVYFAFTLFRGSKLLPRFHHCNE